MKLFYSHASRQKPLVRELTMNLGARFDHWVDETALKLGDGISLTIAQAIAEDVDLFVLILCRDAAASEWVKKEVDLARKREAAAEQIFIYTIVLDQETLDTKEWEFIKERKYIKLTSFEAPYVEAAASQLKDAILEWLITQRTREPISRKFIRKDQLRDGSFAEWLVDVALKELSEEYDETIVDRRLSDVFVCPPLYPQSSEIQRPEDDGDAEPDTIDYDHLIDGEENWLILVPPEHGHTSLARHIALTTLQQAKKLNRPRLPTIVDAARWSTRRPYAADFLRMLRRGSPDNIPMPREQMLSAGQQLIIVENLDLTNPGLISFIEEFARKNASCRYVFLARASLVGSQPGEMVVQLGVPARTCKVAPFERRHVRQFLKSWGVPPASDLEDLLSSTMERFAQLNVPITGGNLSLYMYVLEQGVNYTPINLATLIEMFIEAVLEKNDPRMVFRHQFDFKNKVDFLASIARKMVEKDEFALPLSEFIAASDSYFDHLEVDQSTKDMLDYFTQAQILTVEDDVVSFRYTVFFSFFAAKAMEASQETRELIISRDNCTRYLTELDIYFGLIRNDSESLSRIAEFHREADNALDALLKQSGFAVENEFVETLSIRRDRESNSVIGALADKMARQPDHAERDTALGDPIDQRIGLIQELKRPKFRDAVARWVMTLRAYSIAVKNMELISGAEKRRHLLALFDSWSKATATGVLLAQGLARDGKVTIGTVTLFLDEEAKKKLKGKMLRWFYLMVPHAVGDYMKRDLGSPKLARLLRDPQVVEGRILPRFLQSILASDLRISGYIEGLEAINGELKGSPYLREALLWHLYRIFYRRTFLGREEKDFRELVASVAVDAKGYKGRRRTEERAVLLQKMEQKRLVENKKNN